MSETIFQVSDLASPRRTEFIGEARKGLARLRDKDGTSLVMVPEGRLAFMQRLNDLMALHLRLDVLSVGAGKASIHELGQHAWLRSLDVDDLRQFGSELGEALVVAQSDGHTELADNLVDDWRVTAQQLDDPLRRAVLTGRHDIASDFVNAERPTGEQGETVPTNDERPCVSGG